MRLFCLTTVIMLSTVGSVMSQSTRARLTEPGAKRNYIGLSHIEIDLGQQNTLLIGFDRYAQIQARQNIDSVLRLFVADYQKVDDTTQSPTRATHALFRLGETDRALAMRYSLQIITSFRFRDGDEPVLIKTQQDTLQIAWVSTLSDALTDDFSVYLFVNSLYDVERLLRGGGLNQKVQRALESVRQYKYHDLTNPKMAFGMLQSTDNKARILHPGLARNPFLSFQPGIAVSLIRNQLVPSFNFDIQFIPSRFHQRGYSVGYTSNFFFAQSPNDGRFQLFRNDFVNFGVTIYRRNQDSQTAAFNHPLVSFYAGLPIHRTGPYFDMDDVRMGSTVYQKGLLKVQAEVYTKGFFKDAYPSVRLLIGL